MQATSAAHILSNRPFSPQELTLGDFLRQAAAQAPDTPALTLLRDPTTGVQRQWTYARLLQACEAVAQQLLEKFTPGEHIALWSPNRPEWIVLQFGAAMAGLVVVATSAASRSHELGYVLQQSDAVGIIHSRQMGTVDGTALIASLRTTLPRLREAIAFEDWPVFGQVPASPRALPQVSPHQPVMIQYTSGTTGKPKGAMLSHYALVTTTKSLETCFELEPGSVWLNPMPLHATAGCVFTTMSAIWNRGTQVLLPRFDAELVFRGIEEEGANWIPLVPTMAIALLEHPSWASRNFSSVKVVVAGGASVAPELVKRIEGSLGVDFMIAFGQTESSGTVTITRRRDSLEHRSVTIGYPLAGVDLRICDPETHRSLPFGEVGELCMRGPAIQLTYYKMPEATASAVDAEGWLHSGDLATLDADGYARITGRLKEMIIRGGSNIYPLEIEEVLGQHHAIAEAAVFGLPDPVYGEVVVAAIRVKAGAALDPQGINDFLGQRLSRYKLPAHVWFVERFPLTLSGKIQKFVLREQFLAAHGPAVASAKA